jgi:thiol-disulfide isomerase/thioredoxin
MQRSHTRPIFQAALTQLVLALAVFCAFAGAGVRQEAPRFTARTLDGSTFTSASLEGRVTLLQFWVTWCPHCRADEAALDDLGHRFSGQGLVVLAVDEGEPEATVDKYLHEHPRSVRIVLDEHKGIARRFGTHGYPSYVLLDRQGRIAGTQRGESGEDSLLALLRRAGLRSGSDATQAAGQDPPQAGSPSQAGDPSAGAAQPGGMKVIDVPGGNVQAQPRKAERRHSRRRSKREQARERTPAVTKIEAGAPSRAAAPSGIKMIEVPAERHARAARPTPETVFVLRGGERLESDHYTMDRSYLHAVVNGEPRTIDMSELDVPATEAANHARGVEVKIPNSQGEVFVAF